MECVELGCVIDMMSVRGFLMDCRPAEVKSQQTMVRIQACHFSGKWREGS
jgi:hypothetical protein